MKAPTMLPEKRPTIPTVPKLRTGERTLTNIGSGDSKDFSQSFTIFANIPLVSAMVVVGSGWSNTLVGIKSLSASSVTFSVTNRGSSTLSSVTIRWFAFGT